MRSFITVIFLLLPFSNSNASINGITEKGEVAIQKLQDWHNQTIKPVVYQRIVENQYLIEFLEQYSKELVSTEIDLAFDRAVNRIVEDQLTLSSVTMYLYKFDQSEKINFDQFLEDNSSLREAVLMQLNRPIQQKNGLRLVQRILYLALMERYMRK